MVVVEVVVVEVVGVEVVNVEVVVVEVVVVEVMVDVVVIHKGAVLISVSKSTKKIHKSNKKSFKIEIYFIYGKNFLLGDGF